MRDLHLLINLAILLTYQVLCLSHRGREREHGSQKTLFSMLLNNLILSLRCWVCDMGYVHGYQSHNVGYLVKCKKSL